MDTPNSLAQAKLLKSKYYFTGKPCKHGHIANRATVSGSCVECTAKATVQWMNKQPREIILGYAAAYRERNQDRIREENKIAARERRAKDPEKFKQMQSSRYRKKVLAATGKAVKAFNRTDVQELIARLDEAHLGNYRYLSGYSSMNADATFTCTQHNATFVAQPHNVLRGAKSCPQCSHMMSAGEESLAAFMEQFTVVERRKVGLLDGRHEIDVYAPELKLGVEYHGLYYHCGLEAGKKHLQKWKKASEIGIRLIQMFEDEWLHNRAACENRISALLGGGVRYDARKCKIQQIKYAQAAEFLTTYHLQGAGNKTGQCYGLYSNEQLIAVATFGKARDGAGNSASGWEVLRYASLGTVRGGFGKLFAEFCRAVNPLQVISWCDLRWGDGRVYKTLGFTSSGVSKQDYWWADCAKRVRISRYAVQKHKLKTHPHLSEFYKDELSETEILDSAGYKKIYGVGNEKWVWTNPNTA